MKATIYHNPECGASRKALEMLRNLGVELTVVDYLRNPPTKAELDRIFKRAGISPREGLRAKEQLAQDLDLLGGRVSDKAILDAMAANPILIERPLVETDKGACLARPVENLREII